MHYLYTIQPSIYPQLKFFSLRNKTIAKMLCLTLFSKSVFIISSCDKELKASSIYIFFKIISIISFTLAHLLLHTISID
jgi:uncharacterized membrane protein